MLKMALHAGISEVFIFKKINKFRRVPPKPRFQTILSPFVEALVYKTVGVEKKPFLAPYSFLKRERKPRISLYTHYAIN